MSAKRHRRARPNATGRSSKDRFVQLRHAMLKSAAYRSLSVGARALLVEFGLLYRGPSTVEVGMSVRQAAAALGTGKNFAEKMLAELQAKGFIKTRARGWFGHAGKLATTWWLTWLPCDGREPTREYLRWQPPTNGGEVFSVPPRGTTSPATGDINDSVDSGNTAPAAKNGLECPSAEDNGAAASPSRGDTLNIHTHSASEAAGRESARPDGGVDRRAEVRVVESGLVVADNPGGEVGGSPKPLNAKERIRAPAGHDDEPQRAASRPDLPRMRAQVHRPAAASARAELVRRLRNQGHGEPLRILQLLPESIFYALEDAQVAGELTDDALAQACRATWWGGPMPEPRTPTTAGGWRSTCS